MPAQEVGRGGAEAWGRGGVEDAGRAEAAGRSTGLRRRGGAEAEGRGQGGACDWARGALLALSPSCASLRAPRTLHQVPSPHPPEMAVSCFFFEKSEHLLPLLTASAPGFSGLGRKSLKSSFLVGCGECLRLPVTERRLGRGRCKGRSRKEAEVDGIPFDGSWAVRWFFLLLFF